MPACPESVRLFSRGCANELLRILGIRYLAILDRVQVLVVENLILDAVTAIDGVLGHVYRVDEVSAPATPYGVFARVG